MERDKKEKRISSSANSDLMQRMEQGTLRQYSVEWYAQCGI